MKHKYLWLLVIVVVGLAVFPLRFIIGGNEDTWICSDNQWVKHGNPLEPMPKMGCGPVVSSPALTQALMPSTASSSSGSTNNPGLANPASVYCGEQKGTSRIVTAADGSQSGMCVFPDGRQCDEWSFFRTKVCK